MSIITNYRKAWLDYQKTDAYKASLKILIDYKVEEKYAENILQCAFEAGWNATNTRIKIIEP